MSTILDFVWTNGDDVFEAFNPNNSGIVVSGFVVNTLSGDDTITGTGFFRGISNSGTINTGNGNDIVDALTGGFFCGGTILLGNGDDLIRGSQNAFRSGLAQKVDGGSGFDTAELGIDFSLGNLSRTEGFDIAIGGMWYKNVELFIFNDVQYDLASLQRLVPEAVIV
jgi:hypothetical protein